MNKSQLGFSLIETMVATAVLSTASLIIIGSFVQLNQLYANTKVDESVDLQIQQIIESIRPNVGKYQVNYGAIDQNNTFNPFSEGLKMAWAPGVVAKAEDCPTCPGRFGYKIEPYTVGLRGLFIVTVRFSHTDWEKKGIGHKDYEFIATPR